MAALSRYRRAYSGNRRARQRISLAGADLPAHRLLPGIYLYHPSRRQTALPLVVFLKFIEKWRKRSACRPRRMRKATKFRAETWRVERRLGPTGYRLAVTAHEFRAAGSLVQNRD
jgi:hypothetical protein